MTQLELVFEAQPEAPGHDLAQIFWDLNHRHWGGELPEFHCEWSARMITTWGICYRDRRVIRISDFFRTRPREEVEALLSHEMIHILHRGHGKRFRRELKRIGLEGDVQRRFPHLNELTGRRRRPHRYVYECSSCRVRIRRRRRIRGYCSLCWQRGIRTRFRLVSRLKI